MKNNIIRYSFIFVFSLLIAIVTYAQVDPKVELMKDYDKLMKSDSSKIDAHRNFITKWKDRTDDLSPIYEKLANSSPDKPLYQYTLGYVYASSGKNEYIDKAIDSFKKATELDPNFTLAHFSLGAMYLRKGDYRPAEIELQKSIELDENFYSAYYNLGEVYRSQKQYDLALMAYKKAITINQRWGFPYYGTGLIYFAQDRLLDADIQFKQAVRYNPEISGAYFKMGQIYAKQDMDIEIVSQAYKNGQKAIQGQAGKKEEGDAFYELGKIFSEKGKSGLAVQAYKNAINIDANMASAQFELGTEYYKMGLKERALEHYKLAIQADPSIRKSFLDEAKKQYESGNIESALAALDKTISVDPENAEAHYYYADIQQKSNNIPEAIKHYGETIRLDPSFIKAYLPLGDLYYSQNKMQEATNMYRKGISLDQSLERYFFNAGTSALESAESDQDIEKQKTFFDNARISFDKHIMLYPDDPEANYKLARAYDGIGDKTNAMKYYQKAAQIDPSRADVLIRIASIFKNQQKWDDSLAMLSKITALVPPSNGRTAMDKTELKVNAYRMIAEIQEKLGNLDVAISSLEEVVKIDPSDSTSHYKLGVFYEEKKSDIDRAMIEYEAVINLDQTKGDPFLRLGTIYVKKSIDENKIMDVYEKGLIIDPNHPQIQYDLAILYKKNGNIDKAIEHYDQANQLSPRDYQWHYEFAKLLEGKDNAKAVREYTKTIELKRDFASAYFDRAMLLKKVKVVDGRVYRTEQIIEDFKQVTELEPTRAEAYFNIGMLYKELEAEDTARTYFEKTIKVNPSYVGAHLEIGLIAEQRNEFARAMDEYRKEIAINDKAALAYQRLGFLYSHNKTQEFEKAEEQLIKALKIESDNIETLIYYANVLYSLDKLGQSADQYEKILQMDPKNITANFNLALVYMKWGKNKLAIEQWQKFLSMNPPGSYATEARKYLKELGAK
jgi:tetratricopeptide (TPR) repeat protein